MEKQFWIGKKAKIEVNKNGKRLFFTAHILENKDSILTFIDKHGEVYSFNTQYVREMVQLK